MDYQILKELKDALDVIQKYELEFRNLGYAQDNLFEQYKNCLLRNTIKREQEELIKYKSSVSKEGTNYITYYKYKQPSYLPTQQLMVSMTSPMSTLHTSFR